MRNIFNRFFQSLVGSSQTQAAPVVYSDYQDDIPRYPPFVKGLPRAPRERIVQDQSELINKIKLTFNMPVAEFEQIVLPVIHNYAGFVHLLPASEAHHHKGAGGLFRHGLEVGYWAAKAINGHEMCVGEQPKLKRNNEIRWQFAAFLGGMLHDIGKPLADMQIVDRDGNREWNPYAGFLDHWLYEEDIDRYFLRWRSQRAQRHRKYSTLTIGTVLTDDARSYLNKYSPDIMEALLDSLVGSSMHGTLTKIVINSDAESVKRDLLSQRISPDEDSYGVPVERYILDCVRRIASKDTKVNCKGAHIWRGEQGVFIAWRQISDIVAQMLRDSGVVGVPNSYETTADIMLENQYAEPFFDANGERNKRFWTIAPEALGGIELNCLLFIEVAQIFPNEAPPPVPITVIDSFGAKYADNKDNPTLEPSNEIVDLEKRFDEYNKLSAYAEYVDYFDYLDNKDEFEDYGLDYLDESNIITATTEAATVASAPASEPASEPESAPVNEPQPAQRSLFGILGGSTTKNKSNKSTSNTNNSSNPTNTNNQSKPTVSDLASKPSASDAFNPLKRGLFGQSNKADKADDANTAASDEEYESSFTNNIENYVTNSTLETLRRSKKPIDTGSEAVAEALKPKAGTNRTAGAAQDVNPILAYVQTNRSPTTAANSFNAAEHKAAVDKILAQSKATGEPPRTQGAANKPKRPSNTNTEVADKEPATKKAAAPTAAKAKSTATSQAAAPGQAKPAKAPVANAAASNVIDNVTDNNKATHAKPAPVTPPAAVHEDGDDFDAPISLKDLLSQNQDKRGTFKPKDD